MQSKHISSRLILPVIIAIIFAFGSIAPFTSFNAKADSGIYPLAFEEIIPESENLLYLRSSLRNIFNRYFRFFGIKSLISATEIDLDTKTLSLAAGTSEFIDADVVPSDARNENVVFKSDNPKIATVSSFGQVIALKPGKVTVYAVAEDGGFYEKCLVTVTEGTVYCDTVTLPCAGINLGIGETAEFDVTVFPVNTTNAEMLLVSDISIVHSTLSDGLLTVTGKSTGTSVVTVMCGDYYDTLYVNVINPENPPVGAKLNSVSLFGGNTATSIGTIFRGMEALSDGGYIACGTTVSADGSFEYLYRDVSAWLTPYSFVVKFSSTGSVDWIKLIGDSSAAVSLYDIAVLSDGSIAAVGTYDIPSSNTQTGGIDAIIVRLSSDGKLLSKSIIGDSGDDFLYSIAATESGYVVGGKTNSINGIFEGGTGISSVILNYDLSNTLLLKKFISSSKSSHIADIDVDGNGDIFIACTTTSTDGDFTEFDELFGSYADTVVLKYNSSGELLWSHIIATSGTDLFEAIVADGNGGCYIAGSYTLVSTTEPDGTLDGITNCGGADALVFRIDQDGEREWYQTVSGFYSDYITDIVRTADGIAVTGYSSSSNRDFSSISNGGGTDGFICVLDCDGNRTGIASQSGTNDDAGLCLAYSATDDEILVAGKTKSDNGDFDGNPCGGSLTGYVGRYTF